MRMMNAMRMISIFLSIFFVFILQVQVQGQGLVAVGEGSVIIEDEEQKDLYKDLHKEYIYNDAFLMGIVSYLNNNGLDGTQFLNQYKSKLQKGLTYIEKDIDIATKDKNLKKLKYNIDFFKKNRLPTVISSYKMKNSFQDPSNSKRQILQLEVVINRQLLIPIYNGMMGIKTIKGQQKLYLACSIRLENLDWSLLGTLPGISGENIICDHLVDNWRKYLIEESDKFFKESEVEAINAEKRNFYESKFSRGNESGNIVETNVVTPEANSIDLNLSMIKLEVVVKEIKNNSLLKKRTIQIDGTLTIFDLKNNRIIDGFEFNKRIFNSFYGANTSASGNKITSELSGNIYRAAVPALEKVIAVMKKNLTNINMNMNTTTLNRKLNVRKFRNFLDIINLQNGLLTKGGDVFRRVYPSFYENDLVILSFESNASEDEVKNMILSLDGRPISDSLNLIIPDKQNIFNIQLQP
ncbi:MAG: hypothetical protein HQK49_11240 [Oligoflexia bacterium]|nr:hypothetical protein [Oligoflexia bacterium]